MATATWSQRARDAWKPVVSILLTQPWGGPRRGRGAAERAAGAAGPLRPADRYLWVSLCPAHSKASGWLGRPGSMLSAPQPEAETTGSQCPALSDASRFLPAPLAPGGPGAPWCPWLADTVTPSLPPPSQGRLLSASSSLLGTAVPRSRARVLGTRDLEGDTIQPTMVVRSSGLGDGDAEEVKRKTLPLIRVSVTSVRTFQKNGRTRKQPDSVSKPSSQFLV